MTLKPKKTSQKRTQARVGRVGKLHASFEDDLQSLMETGKEAPVCRDERMLREREALLVAVDVV